MRRLQGLSSSGSPSPSGSTTTTLSNSQTLALSKTGSVTYTPVGTFSVYPSFTGSPLPSNSFGAVPSYSVSSYASYTVSQNPSYTVSQNPSYIVSHNPTYTTPCVCPTIQASPSTIPIPVINTAADTTCFPSIYLITIGVPTGCVILIILSLIYNLYRKYKNLKLRFAAVNSQLELQKNSMNKQFQVRNILGRTV